MVSTWCYPMALAAVLLALVATPVAAWQSRCRALGQYQAQPMIFRCDGAKLGYGGSASHNQFRILVPKGTTYSVVDIPIGTEDFRISMSAETIQQSVPAQLLLQDVLTGEFIIRDKMTKVPLPQGYQDRQYTAKYKDMHIDFYEHLAAPRSQQVILHGRTPGALRIVVRNMEQKDVLVHFKKYDYKPYTVLPAASGTSTPTPAPLPMCGFEKPAVGCLDYDQTRARTAVIEFCKNVVDEFPDQYEAWSFAMMLVSKSIAGSHAKAGAEIPYFMWEKFWGLFSARPDYTWKAYKFITHGGLESNTKGVTEDNLNFCYRLPKVDKFAKACCVYLKKTYSNAQAAFTSQAEAARNQGLRAGSGDGLFSMCKSNAAFSSADPKNIPDRHSDYLDLYLDADGYQGLLPHDLDYCWVGTTLGDPLGKRQPLPTTILDGVGLDSSAAAPSAPTAKPVAYPVGPTTSLPHLGYRAALAQAGPSSGQEFPADLPADQRLLLKPRGASPMSSDSPGQQSAEAAGFAGALSAVAATAAAGVTAFKQGGQQGPSFKAGAAEQTSLQRTTMQSLQFGAISLTVGACICSLVLLGIYLLRRSYSKHRAMASPYGGSVQLAPTPDAEMHGLLSVEG